MAKTQKKKVQMPAGIRNKLMAAVAMLLVSSIMVVSSTYAWFTLSTAPEVTGITTSVGANGNLEMALLNGVAGGTATTDTFADLSKITSAVGDSSAVKAVTDANITWGNLVDLSDDSYGLKTINLQPSRLKVTEAATADDSDKVATGGAGILQIPVYGADGRVASLSANTYSTASFTTGTNTWAYSNDTQSYGVRAIGANDSLTTQQAGLIAAKGAYNTNLNKAKAAIQAALSTNGADLASAITTLAMDSSAARITTEQEAAITAMVDASEEALGFIDAAYKQVLLAAASKIEDATNYSTATGAINGATSFADALTAASSNGVTVPDGLTTASTNLTEQKSAVTEAEAALSSNYKLALSKLVDTTLVTINGYEVGTDSEETSATKLMVTKDGQTTINPAFMNKVIADGGAIVAMPDNSGVFAYIGSVAGNYSASCTVSVSFKGLTLNDMPATMKTTATVDTTVPTALNAIRASGTSTGATALSDTYGYALDFAFRTNASGSKLQLQTAAKQRVYTDGSVTNELTQGSGSNMTFKSATNPTSGAAVLTDAQVQELMKAIRVAFVDPDTGAIYGIAAMTTFENTADGIKGDLVLMNYDVADDGVITLRAKAEDDAKDDIMELAQNTATKLTAIVWLDGDRVDNGDVANAAQSLTGSMNLQFSSSVELQPMQNTALKNITETTTSPAP